MKFDDDFKEAVLQLPVKEKDKLLLRLLKKDKNLVNQLYFQLVNNETVPERRAKVETLVLRKVIRATETFVSCGYLMMDVRYISGDITEHVKTTKDKYGEISLNLLMLAELLKRNVNRIENARPKDSHKLSIYILNRIFKVLTLIRTIHEDYRVDFEDKLNEIGELIGSSHLLMNMAIYNGLDVNWLLSANIPDDIANRYKELRAGGFLR